MLAIARTARAWVEHYLTAPLDLLGRWMIGEIFFRSGLVKLASFETTVDLFRDEYRTPFLSPEVAAILATATELTMPVLLILGLFARLAAIPMLVMTFVIQATYFYHSEHYFWAIVLLAIIIRGPGAWSIDHWLRRRFG
ncbi:MAG: DoxX family protein [Elstera sp.]